MTTTLITGSNRGRGLETARRLVEAGHTVYAGMRDTADGDAARAVGAHPVQLDVDDQASVDDLTPKAMAAVLQTNVVGIVRVTQAALPLLRASAAPVIVNVASGVGWPRALRGDGTDESHVMAIPYATSKAALITATVQYAKNLPGFRINAADSGYTATEFNGNTGHQTVTEGTDATVAMALVGPDGPTGEFHSRHGRIEY